MTTPTNLHADQQAIVRHADATADAAESVVRATWLRILHLLDAPHAGNYFLLIHALRPILSTLGVQIVSTLSHALTQAARHAHALTQDQLRRTLPPRRILREGVLDDLHLFAPMDTSLLHWLLYAGDWVSRIAAQTRLAAPDAPRSASKP